ncbi:unnamed protein product [Colias eurytheme]|nr:unnamed protein product [Colias eurytheme]
MALARARQAFRRNLDLARHAQHPAWAQLHPRASDMGKNSPNFWAKQIKEKYEDVKAGVSIKGRQRGARGW